MEKTLKQILSELQNVNQRMDGFEKHFDNLLNFRTNKIILNCQQMK